MRAGPLVGRAAGEAARKPIVPAAAAFPASGPRRALGGLWNAQTILGRVTPVRDLTDAAREGLNFQAHCTDLFHFDLPWNPGRIDRKLRPAPEAHCHYFVLHQRAEDRVLDVLVRRTETFKK